MRGSAQRALGEEYVQEFRGGLARVGFVDLGRVDKRCKRRSDDARSDDDEAPAHDDDGETASHDDAEAPHDDASHHVSRGGGGAAQSLLMPSVTLIKPRYSVAV